MADLQAPILRVLCLHGSRQDAEVFSQRLKVLQKKLSGIAELHFLSAPHELPLQPGQQVAMRAWWRHWKLQDTDGPVDDGSDTAKSSPQTGSLEAACSAAPVDSSLNTQTQSNFNPAQIGCSCVAAAAASQPSQQQQQQRVHMHEVHEQLAAGWEDVVVRDWEESRQVIQHHWKEHGGFDGILGFSNGAAAAFLFACHAAAHQADFASLKFVLLAGGYIAEPLNRLVPSHLVHPATDPDSPSHLLSPLSLPSLHMSGVNDPAVAHADSLLLSEAFSPATRQLLIHQSGHCVPQKSEHCQTICSFLASFLPSAPVKPHRAPRAPLRHAAPTSNKKHLPHPAPLAHAATADAQSASAAATAALAATTAQLSLHRPAAGHVHKPEHHTQHQHQPGAAGHSHHQTTHLPKHHPHHSLPKHNDNQVHDTAQDKQQQQKQQLQETGLASHPQPQNSSPNEPPAQTSVSSCRHATQASQPAHLAQASQVSQASQASQASPASQPLQASRAPQVPQAFTASQASHAPQPPHSPQASQVSQPAKAAEPAQPASEEQQEEMDALQAIFMDEYLHISQAPPKFSIQLREPGTEPDPPGELSSQGPPARLFSIIFTLPPAYPSGAIPQMQINGPLGGNDPRRRALMQHLQDTAQEAMDSTASGCVFQLVEAAKEWINTNLPPDVGMHRDAVATSSGPAAEDPQQATGDAGEPADAPAAAGGTCWWEKEEADGALVRRAIQEAAAANWRSVEVKEEQEADDSRVNDAEWSSSGRWDYVVGLVGKPSAGKSTFFNAITDPVTDDDGARVAAFPFTTIAPNVGRGYFLVPDPCHAAGLSPQDCKPAHGYVPAFSLGSVNPAYNNIAPLKRWLAQCGWLGRPGAVRWRRVPVLMKDVAGLVPGAYQGRGRGNAFLNDLCDADVLIHVVDAAGSTDREGQAAKPGEGADPVEDVGWVKEELHRWVYDNVRSKWSQVRRKPARLPELFSGYHASRPLVAEVLARVGVDVDALVVEGASLSHWGEWELHRLVAHFLAARFPILLALNKADMEAAVHHIPRVLAALPHDPAVAVSGASERWLCTQRRQGRLEYLDGAAGACMAPECRDEGLAQQLAKVKAAVFDRYGGTGALAAITTAIAMRPPRVVFPVSDIETCCAIPARAASGGSAGILGSGLDAKARAAEGVHTSVLRDCVLMRPGSTTEDVFQVLKKPPYQLLEGDFVRADCRVLSPPATAPTAAAAAAPTQHSAHGSTADSSLHAEHSNAMSVSSSGAPVVSGQSIGSGDSPAAVAENAQQPPHKASPTAAGAAKQSQCWRVMKKDEAISWDNCVLRIMSNKRANWQHKHK